MNFTFIHGLFRMAAIGWISLQTNIQSDSLTDKTYKIRTDNTKI